MQYRGMTFSNDDGDAKDRTQSVFLGIFRSRLDYQPLFGKGARDPSLKVRPGRNSLGESSDSHETFLLLNVNRELIKPHDTRMNKDFLDLVSLILFKHHKLQVMFLHLVT